MCLIYCAALNLLQAIETQGRGGRRGRWNAEEGLKVVQLLGDKSAMNTATFEGRDAVKVHRLVIHKKHSE